MKKNNIPGLEIIKPYFPLEFQISKKAWDFYEFNKGIFPETGQIKSPDQHILRLIVKRMYEKKDLVTFSHQPMRAGHLNAIGLLNEIFRYILYAYEVIKNPKCFENEKITKEPVTSTLHAFVELFPPFHIYRTEGVTNQYIVVKELVLLYLANNNPALDSFLELFNDRDLEVQSPYEEAFGRLEEFFRTQPGFGSRDQPLISLLREPIKASPNSLKDQLIYIKENWESILPEELLYRILTAIDILKEEEKLGLLGHGPSLVPRFDLEEYQEFEQYTMDKDWMSKVVLIAKSTYVWLDQLSKKYSRAITKLNEIPDEELDILARWGFTGLWLIGIWERSPASQRIKQICGNPEALASAYSLYDYRISEDLGGESAFENLKHRAWLRGIRLSTDIVPNHTGIYSKWVIEHPDWYIQLPYPPFPSYNFTGVDLSYDPRVCIQIEDGYWTRRDAAVVFKRIDKWTGDTRYIYHGNDGTSMPWNDTAQLNFLRQDVREAVIQLILSIARKFQIIRLDAAMTLTKKHYQRLWFPHPGTGGGIPSRAEHGILKRDFDKLMPKEFWREVVDRINEEMPDTLLIAEAFWLMEGYFVRTLGMHRVYNSAFMNMLKMEENEKYRSVIKNVLEFDPQILKRFVNFQNNPDELTAIEQFGKGDKYIGVCLLMVTMPGLPMFGHGQIEGFREKYGMEYRQAYWNEEIDWDLVRRHEHEIFPLMRRRHLFSGVSNFRLYDFFRPEGTVNENVFAYSNRAGNERALIIYNNKFENACGWIRTSCAFKSNGRRLIQDTLAGGLGIRPECYYIFRDNKTNLEYIRYGRDICEKGLYIELGAYQYHAFIDFREIMDTPLGYYSRLNNQLNGRGVHNIEEALNELVLSPIHTPFKKLIRCDSKGSFKNNLVDFLKAVKGFTNYDFDESLIYKAIIEKLDMPPHNNIITTWLIYHNLEKVKIGLFSELLLERATQKPDLIRILCRYCSFDREILKDPDVQKYLNFNYFNNHLWFSKEKLEELLSCLSIISAIAGKKQMAKEEILQKASQAGYKMNEFVDLL